MEPLRGHPATATAGLAVGALVINALVWGLSWIPFRHLDALGLHVLWSTAAVFSLVAMVLIAARPHAPGLLFRSPALIALMFASGMTNACFNWAVTVGEVIRVVLLFYLMPVWAVLLARWMLDEPIRPAVLARVTLALAGAWIILSPPGGFWPVPETLADGLALAGGLSFAFTNVLLRRSRAVPAEARALAMFTGGTLVALLTALGLMTAGLIAGPLGAGPFGEPATPLMSQTNSGAPLLPGVGLLAGLVILTLMMLVGNLCLQYGAARLPASVTAVVLLTEILFAAVSAIALGNETLTTATVIGGLMIIASSALAAHGQARESRESTG